MTEIKDQELTPEKFEELTNKIAAVTQERDNVVGEIKEDREKRQALQDQIDTLTQALQEATRTNAIKPAEGVDSNVIKQTVEQLLAEKEASVAKSNQVTAIEKFINENSAFSTENDPTGKKREALVAKVKMFNTSGLSTVEQFYSVVRDAANLLGVHTTSMNSSEAEVDNPYSSTSQSSYNPSVARDADLSPKEAKLIQQNGWTKERYLALKANNPSTVEGLLRYIE